MVEKLRRPVAGSSQARERSRIAAPLLLLLPALVIFFILFVLPQAGLLGQSFVSDTGPTLTFRHYTRFLGDPHYLGVLARTLVMGIGVVAITLVLGYPLAYWLARIETRWKPLLLVATIFPLLTSAVVRSFGWMVLFYETGLVTRALQAIGVGESAALMYTFPGVVVALSEVLLPFMVLTLYGVIRSINRDLEEAAMNLGAGPITTLLYVTIPLSLGGVLAGSLLVFSLAISTFVTPALIGGDRVEVMATAIYAQTISLLDWQFAGALATVLFVVVLALVSIYSLMIERIRTERR